MRQLPALSGLDSHSRLDRRRATSVGKAQLRYQSDVHVVDMVFGSQTFPLVVDTGSSETIIAGTGFQCLDQKGNNVSFSQCGLGNLYAPSSTFQLAPNETLATSFGGGDVVTGYVGTERVSMGGIEVTQKIGVMTQGYWEIATGVSGLVGMAYPSLSYIYDGRPPPNLNESPQNVTNLVLHNPLFWSMIASGKLPSNQFTMILDRAENGSSLTLGGIPSAYANAKFASVPIIPQMDAIIGEDTLVNTLYRIPVSAVVVDGKANTTSYTTFVDSGGKAISVDPTVALRALKAFDPPGQVIQGVHVVNCTAKAPSLEITIGNGTFTIDPKDLVDNDAPGLPEGLCLSTIYPSDVIGFTVLGNPFLRSVVAVYDVGTNQMHFTSKHKS